MREKSYLNDNSKYSLSITPSELMYFVGITAYFSLMFLSTTMYSDILPLSNHTLRNTLRFTCYGFILVKMLLIEKFTLKRIVVYVVIAFPMLMCYRITGYIYELDMYMLIIGARGIKAEHLIRWYFYLSFILLAITFIGLAGGLIENRTFIRSSGTRVRNSVGFIYPTDFGARVFFFLLAFCFMIGKRFNFLIMGAFFAISGLLAYYCDARLDAGLIAIAGILFYLNARTKFFTIKWIEKILIFSVPIFFAVSYWVTMSYLNGPFFKTLDKLLSYRLMYGYYNMYYVGIHPFGHYIYQQGHGALNYSAWSGYNFVDCGYIQALLQYGYILMFIVLVMFVLISWTAVRRGQHGIALMVFMVGLTSCIDHHFLEFWYDPFPLLVFSVIPYAQGYRRKSVTTAKVPDIKEGVEEKVTPVPKGLSHNHDVWGELIKIQKRYR